MSCNCNKCQPNNCGCADAGLTNPCSYTDCGPRGERCEDSIGAECVVWTGPTTEVEDAQGNTFVISEGERVEQLLQRMALVLADGLGTCTSSNQFHAPWNIYFGTVTSNSIQILWAGEDSATTSVQIEMDTAVGSSGFVPQGTVTEVYLILLLLVLLLIQDLNLD
ncbi:MAG: hypothetical protein CM15mV42_0420 [uncultured marine virus]|nr:MAG: hypothetical protein CM15mV42_0420 [uncultured marine virus]